MDPSSERSDPGGARARILVVEPYAAGRASICASLSELGYEVIGAASAAVARAITSLFLIDVLVADVDDRAICELVCELYIGASPIRSVRLTTDAVGHACTAPGVRMLEKPTRLTTLEEAIEWTLTA